MDNADLLPRPLVIMKHESEIKWSPILEESKRPSDKEEKSVDTIVMETLSLDDQPL